MKDYQSKLYGALGSALPMLLIFLLLWFIMVDKPYEPEDEGIMVSFGDSDVGGGQPIEAAAPVQTVAPPPKPSQPSPNDLMTQEDEKTLALEKQRKEEEKKKKAEEAERIRKQKEEQARIEAERIAKEKAIAEQKAKEQAAIDKANQLGSLFGNSGTTGGGNGTDNATSTKGNPLGSGTSGGNSWSLKGRTLKSLPRPSSDFKQEGTVVVKIQVDSSGKVVSAVVDGGTISDSYTRKLAVDAAYKAQFDTSETVKQEGSITYKFSFR